MARLPGESIVGRDEELATVREFVRSVEGGHRTLVIEGAAGIGKTTLWLAANRLARGAGWTVLTSQPAAAEVSLAYAGLADLLTPVVDELLPELYPPRRRALEEVLLRREAGREPVDSRTLAVAVHDGLEVAATRGPIVIAIDDIQWLDASSIRALSFALRRLDDLSVNLLLARRTNGAPVNPELERALGAEITRLALTPLSAGAVHRFLHDSLGVSFPRQTLLRIHERSGGNPFVAREIALALPEVVDPLQSLPVPKSVEELVRGRLADLPERTLRALALVAAIGNPSEEMLRRAGVPAEALDAAESADIITREEEVVRFSHPLFASVLYEDLAADRAQVHAQIAEVAEDPVVCARHLALSTATPDDRIAKLLETAAETALDRGAPAMSAELAEQAVRLTPERQVTGRIRRTLAAARAHVDAGEWTRARAIATDLLAEVPSGRPRAECLLLLAEFEHDDRAVPVLEEALVESATDPQLAPRVQILLGWARRFRSSFPAAREAVLAGLALAERVGDLDLQLEALEMLVVLGNQTGDPATDEYVERARVVAAKSGHLDQIRRAEALTTSAFTAGSADRELRCTKLLAAVEHWRERDELFASDLLLDLAWVELEAGRWALAADHADEAHRIRIQYGVEQNQDYIPISWIAGLRGDVDAALRESARGLRLCEEQIGFHPPLLKAVPGFVALALGDPATAIEHLAEADSRARAMGWSAPDARPWTADYVEALVQLDRIDEAGRVLDDWDSDAARLGRGGSIAAVTRCRGLVAAARGSVADAISLLELAATQHAAENDRFGHGRARLALGIALRRTRQRRAARESLTAAAADFECLGAALWLRRAHAELGRIGGHAPSDGLSPAERRVASLVAEGRTNHEVAAALFLSERTVASHLTRVYAKLGVRSRTELASKIHNI